VLLEQRQKIDEKQEKQTEWSPGWLMGQAIVETVGFFVKSLPEVLWMAEGQTGFLRGQLIEKGSLQSPTGVRYERHKRGE
jgi:hypothetical protein